jgi:hypothetical protein
MDPVRAGLCAIECLARVDVPGLHRYKVIQPADTQGGRQRP